MVKTSIEIDSKVNELYSKTYVTQKIKNDSENPLELKIYIYKKANCIFSSFSAKIGDSITVKSKIIKKEKAEQKYTDSISSGNAAIFVSDDPSNENRIIINMGNIPPKEELTFISEFIQYTESADTYEFELFRNLPILAGKDSIYQNEIIKGQVEIKTKNKMSKIDKKILNEKLVFTEDKYLDEENKNHYIIKYEYNNLSNLSLSKIGYIDKFEDYDYIPSSKIYFELELNEPIIFCQKSALNEKEKNYIIQYRNITKKPENGKINDLNLNPALFIFLIDQSGSMIGNPIKVASKAILLFLQSLPAGSYYQLIGFGSKFIKYDLEPNEYKQENISKSIETVEKLTANLGGTDIYSPLKDIYESNKIYDKINLPRNIFLLTDGEIENKKDTLAIIEKNSDKYSIYSIGIGKYFDEDLIKNAGIIGKGNYNFCKNINELNEIIATEVSNASSPYISNFSIKTPFDGDILYKTNNLENIIIKKNKLNNFSYIIENKEKNENGENNNVINDNTINIEIKYKEFDRYKDINEQNKEISEKYGIIPEEIPIGEELSKLIINNYILNNSNLNEEEKTKLSLKYQIFSENTSLFAEVELSEKINDEMKTEIIGNKENNQIKKLKPKFEDDLFDKMCLCDDYDNSPKFNSLGSAMCYSAAPRSSKKKSAFPTPSFGFLKSIGNSIKGLFSFSSKKETERGIMCKQSAIPPREDYDEDICYDKADDLNDDYLIKNIKDNSVEDKKEPIKENIKEEKIDLNNKENIMKIINTQDFVGGSWDINDKTKIIKEKYEKEFELLKGLKNKNIDDKIAMTIIIIYFINKEHSELLKELVMIIKKGMAYIQEKTNDTYENIIKEIGL